MILLYLYYNFQNVIQEMKTEKKQQELRRLSTLNTSGRINESFILMQNMTNSAEKEQ